MLYLNVVPQKLVRQWSLFFMPYLAFLGLMWAGLIRFQTNDDPGYFLISNGSTYGHPSSQLLFPGRLIGLLITGLESLVPGVNWYPVFMAVSLLTAISLLTYCFMTLPNFNILNNKILFSYIILLLVTLQFIYRMQFTQTAFFVAFVGVFALISFHLSKFATFTSFILIACGISWRNEAGVLGVSFAIFLYFVSGIVNSQSRTRNKSLLTKILIVTFITFAINFALWNRFAFWLSSTAREYLTYDFFRGILHGSRYLNSSQSLIDANKLNLSSNDWDLFRSFYFANSEVFSLERIVTLAANVNSSASILSLFSVTFFLQNVIYPDLINICTIILVGFIVTRNRLFKSNLLFWVLVFAPIVIVYLLLGMPSRLFVPILTSAGFTLLFNNLRQLEGEREEISRINTEISSAMLSYFTALILIILSISTFQRESKYVADLRADNRELATIRKFVSDKPIISFPSFYSPLVNVDPFSDVSRLLRIWPQIIPIGTSVGTPDFSSKIERLGISSDLFGTVLEGNAYLGVTSNFEQELVEKYFLEHYKLSVEFISIKDLNPSYFQILKIKMD